MLEGDEDCGDDDAIIGSSVIDVEIELDKASAEVLIFADETVDEPIPEFAEDCVIELKFELTPHEEPAQTNNYKCFYWVQLILLKLKLD